MRSFPARTAALMSAVLAAAAVAGCGGSGSTADSSTPTSTTSSSSTSAESAGMSNSSDAGAAAMGSDSSGPGSGASMSTESSGASGSAAIGSPSAGGDINLKGVCPDTVSLLTDWNPEAEHGGLYELLGPNPKIDAGKKRVSGPLLAHGGKDTGITFEVRSGGPAIGFQTVTSQLYSDPTLTMGYANSDEAIQLSAKQPTTAVFAPLDKNPQMIMWDPATYPDVKTIADLKTKNVKVRYFNGAAYMAYLTGAGILDQGQTDGSYDGAPANFVAAGGKDAQQGFASAEPYIYQNEIAAWKKPIAFQLIHDAGYPIYAAAYSVRTADLATMTPCLKKLVPIFQQAQVDYIEKSGPVNDLILKLVDAYNTGWQYSAGVAAFSVAQQLRLGLVSNGNNKTLGDFDMARLQKILDIDTPIFTKQGTPPAPGLTPEKLATNEFLDPSIGLPAS